MPPAFVEVQASCRWIHVIEREAGLTISEVALLDFLRVDDEMAAWYVGLACNVESEALHGFDFGDGKANIIERPLFHVFNEMLRR